jgi:XRE family transcriptional regulator, regulator of sulfur utilization
MIRRMRPLLPATYFVVIAATAPATHSALSQAAAAQPLQSMVIDWQKLTPTPTATGERRAVFDAPTGTLDRFHGHVTTLNPGQNTGPLHRHPQEELVIIKEGTIEVNIDGRKQLAGPGSMVFFAVNENENMTNVGTTPATYIVLQWYTATTPKG